MGGEKRCGQPARGTTRPQTIEKKIRGFARAGTTEVSRWEAFLKVTSSTEAQPFIVKFNQGVLVFSTICGLWKVVFSDREQIDQSRWCSIAACSLHCRQSLSRIGRGAADHRALRVRCTRDLLIAASIAQQPSSKDATRPDADGCGRGR